MATGSKRKPEKRGRGGLSTDCDAAAGVSGEAEHFKKRVED
jgi:hypothetical protein